MSTLFGRYQKDTYGDLLRVENNGIGVDSTIRVVQDGLGNSTPMSISSSSVRVSATPLTATDIVNKNYVDVNFKLQNSTILYFDDYAGVVADGTTDCSTQWAQFISDISVTNGVGILGSGTYYIPTAPGTVSNPLDHTTPELTGYNNITIVGAGSSSTILKAKKEVKGSGSGGVSWAILKLVSPSSFVLKGVTLDGNSPTASTLSGYADADASALIEIDTCDKVFFDDVKATKFYGWRDNNHNSSGWFGRSGPIFLLGCSNIIMNDILLEYPTFKEGVFLFDCTNVRVFNFNYDGSGLTTYNSRAMSTPLNIFGPGTEDVIVDGFRSIHNVGSAANIGGKGKFVFKNFYIEGYIGLSNNSGDATMDPSLARTTPGVDAFGKGLDFGAEHQENAFVGHPELEGLIISDGMVIDAFSYALRVIKNTVAARRISISNVIIRNSFSGIDIQNCHDVVMFGNNITKVLQYVGESASNGFALKADTCSNVNICNNYLDGSETAVYDYYGTTPPTTRYSRYGMLFSKVSGLTVANNIVKDFRQTHLIFDVDTLEHNIYYPIIVNNKFIGSTYTTPSDSSYAFVHLGRDVATRALAGLVLLGNTYNNVPLITAPVAGSNNIVLVFSTLPADGSQGLTVGSTGTNLSAGSLLGRLDFYSSDGSTPGQGVKARVSAHAGDANGRGAYMSFHSMSTSSGASMLENMRLDTDGKLILNIASPVHILNGSGSPESVVTAPVGSFYLRKDGGTGTTFYVKESGTGNTGWVAK